MDNERQLIKKLRERDEGAFVELVETYHGQLISLASLFVSNKAVAEEVVQEAWLAALRGIGRFEERSSFKTWICRIVMNIARTRGVRESRIVAFSDFADAEVDGHEPAVDPSQFRLPTDDYPDHWSVMPRAWNADPETQLLSAETMAVLDRAVAGLPEAQRTVLTMRDINGWTAEEVCNALEIAETNQRVLLHRARSKVRRILENHFSQHGERAHRERSRIELQGTDGVDNGLSGATIVGR